MTSGAANALGVMAADQRSDGGSGVSLAAEILALVAQHGDNATVDYPAVFILLNTVAGGYYQERFGEQEIQAALIALHADGSLSAHGADGELLASLALPEDRCIFRLTAKGRAALVGGTARG